jgi:tetratricopeptide (TPR) repeat protein
LIREVLYAPPCPEEVAALFETALTHHNTANFALALKSYLEAQNRWEVLRGWENISEFDKERFKLMSEVEKEHFNRSVLVPVEITDDAQVFLRLALGSVFESAAQDGRALAEYLHAQKVAVNLPPEHPSHATVWSSLGSVYAQLSQYDIAADFLLRALDARERALGPRHPDTALALNNIGVVLHRMDRVAAAVEIYTRAEVALAARVAPGHPRLNIVRRNLQRAQRRMLKQGPHNFTPATVPPPQPAVMVPLPLGGSSAALAAAEAEARVAKQKKEAKGK